MIDRRLIFFVNVPVGAVALRLAARTEASPRRPVPFDLAGFVIAQRRVAHPVQPRGMFASHTVVITVVTGFAFMVGYCGLPFVISLFLQQHRGLTALQTGLVLVPMMLIAAIVLAATTLLALLLPSTQEVS